MGDFSSRQRDRIRDCVLAFEGAQRGRHVGNNVRNIPVRLDGVPFLCEDADISEGMIVAVEEITGYGEAARAKVRKWKAEDIRRDPDAPQPFPMIAITNAAKGEPGRCVSAIAEPAWTPNSADLEVNDLAELDPDNDYETLRKEQGVGGPRYRVLGAENDSDGNPQALVIAWRRDDLLRGKCDESWGWSSTKDHKEYIKVRLVDDDGEDVTVDGATIIYHVYFYPRHLPVSEISDAEEEDVPDRQKLKPQFVPLTKDDIVWFRPVQIADPNATEDVQYGVLDGVPLSGVWQGKDNDHMQPITHFNDERAVDVNCENAKQCGDTCSPTVGPIGAEFGAMITAGYPHPVWCSMVTNEWTGEDELQEDDAAANFDPSSTEVYNFEVRTQSLGFDSMGLLCYRQPDSRKHFAVPDKGTKTPEENAPITHSIAMLFAFDKDDPIWNKLMAGLVMPPGLEGAYSMFEPQNIGIGEGARNVGTTLVWARADHVHPLVDTTEHPVTDHTWIEIGELEDAEPDENGDKPKGWKHIGPNDDEDEIEKSTEMDVSTNDVGSDGGVTATLKAKRLLWDEKGHVVRDDDEYTRELTFEPKKNEPWITIKRGDENAKAISFAHAKPQEDEDNTKTAKVEPHSESEGDDTVVVTASLKQIEWDKKGHIVKEGESYEAAITFSGDEDWIRPTASGDCGVHFAHLDANEAVSSFRPVGGLSIEKNDAGLSTMLRIAYSVLPYDAKGHIASGGDGDSDKVDLTEAVRDVAKQLHLLDGVRLKTKDNKSVWVQTHICGDDGESWTDAIECTDKCPGDSEDPE
jgi:hypothetical protein